MILSVQETLFIQLYVNFYMLCVIMCKRKEGVLKRSDRTTDNLIPCLTTG